MAGRLPGLKIGAIYKSSGRNMMEIKKLHGCAVIQRTNVVISIFGEKHLKIQII